MGTRTASEGWRGRGVAKRAGVALLLGVVAAVLSAWMVAVKEAWLGQKGPHGTMKILASLPPGEDRDYCVGKVTRLGYEWWGAMKIRPLPSDASKFERVAWPRYLDSPTGTAEVRTGYATFGWPLRCMSWTEANSGRRRRIPGVPDEIQGMMELRVTDALVVKLPLWPMWAGMSGNVVVIAASIGVMWWGAVAGRRWNRRRRGGCLRCGYLLDGVGGGKCPECGEGMEVG